MNPQTTIASIAVAALLSGFAGLKAYCLWHGWQQ